MHMCENYAYENAFEAQQLSELTDVLKAIERRETHCRVQRKNLRGICPLDLAPELRKLQQNYVEDLFKNACCIENSSHGNPETAHKLHLMGSIKRTPQWRIHVERGSNSRCWCSSYSSSIEALYICASIIIQRSVFFFKCKPNL